MPSNMADMPAWRGDCLLIGYPRMLTLRRVRPVVSWACICSAKTVPAAKALDCGIFNLGNQGCKGGSTYPKAVASIVVLCQACHVEDAANFGYELAFCKGSLIRTDVEQS